MKFKDYFTPKSMVYTGVHTQVSTQIKHFMYDEKGVRISDDLKLPKTHKHYFQVIGLNDVNRVSEIKDIVGVDPLVLEDIFNVKQRTKLELLDGYVFGVLHISYLKDSNITHEYMSLLLYQDIIITFHEYEPLFLDPILELLHKHTEVRMQSADFLFYHILDLITDYHLDVYGHLEGKLDTFEVDMLETKKVNQEEFYYIRKEFLMLKNQVTPIIDQLQKMLIHPNGPLTGKHPLYYEDLKDHLIRLDNQLNQSREMMRHLLDLHMNNQSQIMNQIMKTLTLFSAIFIPLSFLTGFFGMNFIHFNILTYEHAVIVFTAFCLLIVITMILIFKKMKWY